MSRGVFKRNAHVYATDRQRWYLRRLLNEAFAKGWSVSGVGLDYTHYADNPRLFKAEASATIEKLLAAKNAGWCGCFDAAGAVS